MPHQPRRHHTGAYRYLPAIAPYSAGVAAEPGHDIVGLRFERPLPVADAFDRLDRELTARQLAPTAIVGVELRSPRPFTFDGFDEFNGTYRSLLASRGLLEDDVNPVARTNVVPVQDPPDRPVLLAAFVVRPSAGHGGTDFVVAGSGEVEGALEEAGIVARGDLTETGLHQKVSSVLQELRGRLTALGHGPDAPTLVNVYTAHEVPHLATILAERLPAVRRHGYTRWLTRPPLVEVEFEMDLRRVSGWQELAPGTAASGRGRDATPGGAGPDGTGREA